MKRILGIIATAGLIAAAPAFAGVDVFVNLGTPAPVYTSQAPVYVAPVAYRHWEPRWHPQHHRFDHRDFRGHRDFRDHHEHRDYRDHHGHRDYHDQRNHR